MDEYDLIADWYAADRNEHIGVPEVTTLAASLPPGATVLDVGCGNGMPLTRALLAAGCSVVGVDSSERMLEHFRRNFPNTRAVRSTIQASEFDAATFDGAIAWGVLFHLPHVEQAKAVAKIAHSLKTGGLFLFTSGDVDGDKEGLPMNGVPFHYFSFSAGNYRALLAKHALTLIDVHTDRWANTHYLARKDVQPS